MAPELTIAENYSTLIRPTETATHRSLHQRARVLAAMLFVAALFVPLVGSGLHWDPVASSENRVMARFPAAPKNFKQLEQVCDHFLAYYRDHFGLRNTMIRSLSIVKFHGGLAYDRSTNIIIGKDGWLFYPSDPHDLLADRNLEPFTSGELDVWQTMLERRFKFCADHGIKFIAIIPPDKQTVYQEYVPEEFSRLGPKNRVDQLIDRLGETNSPVHVIDLRPVLREAKKYRRIYFKTDTHWNDYGAYAAYPVILDAVNEALPGAKMVPQPLGDFTAQTSVRSGDLGYFLNLYYEYQEDWPQLVRRVPFPQVGYSQITTGSDPRASSLYMIHDSFTRYLYQFLGPHFSRVSWQWTVVMNGPEVLKFKPDILIDEFVERTLFLPTPVDTPDVLAEKPR
jgi:alginate O-acetyltransferase complex protein AlgJ